MMGLLILYIIAISYSVGCLILLYSWHNIHSISFNKNKSLPFISVVVPVRNEEKYIITLLQLLEKQNYPTHLFEVIVANDASTDHTALLVENYRASYPLTLLHLQNQPNSSPKKRAITQAIAQAKGELIVSTDGDCQMEANWLMSIGSFYAQTQAKLISGAVRLLADKTQGFFNIFQCIEFGSLIGTGACSIWLKKPNMCNGANLAYQKKTFLEIGGFAGNENLASGDDEFLMHKIFAQYPNDVYFLKNVDALVSTYAHDTWHGFYQQRKRWASKWKHYKNWQTSALAIFIFLANVGIWSGLIYMAIQHKWEHFLIIYLLKTLIEGLFLARIMQFVSHHKLIKWIPLVQLIYPFYVLLFGLVAQRKGYEWKERKLQ
jgi:glycosyltransferase involved in cell wall biosynthesis